MRNKKHIVIFIAFILSAFSELRASEILISFNLVNYDTLTHYQFQFGNEVVYADSSGVNRQATFKLDINQPDRLWFCANDDYKQIKRAFLDLKDQTLIIDKNDLTIFIPDSKMNDDYRIASSFRDSFRINVEDPIMKHSPKDPNSFQADSLDNIIDSMEIALDKLIFNRIGYSSYIVLHNLYFDVVHMIKYRRFFVEDFIKLDDNLKNTLYIKKLNIIFIKKQTSLILPYFHPLKNNTN